jgi:hypothetical protein
MQVKRHMKVGSKPSLVFVKEDGTIKVHSASRTTGSEKKELCLKTLPLFNIPNTVPKDDREQFVEHLNSMQGES